MHSRVVICCFQQEEKAEVLDELIDSEEDEEKVKAERRNLVIERERQERAQKLGSWKVRYDIFSTWWDIGDSMLDLL